MIGTTRALERMNGAATLADSMTGSLAHRGPDGKGRFDSRFDAMELSLGHRRLSVIDLSSAAQQPMTSRDRRWTITFNGEIFNYRELRAELASQGCSFRSTSDTEVLLEGCAAWGVEKTLARAIGMFAFGLWDDLRRELILARDRVGEKPLVYWWDGATLAFASEMKALKRLHDSRLDSNAVEVYLALGYVPAPLGIFQGTRKLQAGHLARWQAGQLEIRRWWHPEKATPVAEVNQVGTLRELISSAVSLRLRADVPISLALSGGIDSTVVAAEVSRQKVEAQAFTVVFDGDETDLRFARIAAARYRLPHHVIRAEAQSVAREFAASVRHYDEPFADSSGLAALALASVVAGQFKVILNGDGGDEAFAGYRHYEYIGVKQMLKAAAAAAGWCDGQGATGVYVQSKALFRRTEREKLLNSNLGGDALSDLLGADEFLRISTPSTLKNALWSDRHLYLSNDLTYKMDIALGTRGIEGRSPLLDHRILEWSQGLDECELVRGREKKVLLRRAYAAELPAEILSRSKHGFGAPVSRWLEGPLEHLAEEMLPCGLLHREPQAVCSGQRRWALLTFACWAEAWGARW